MLQLTRACTFLIKGFVKFPFTDINGKDINSLISHIFSFGRSFAGSEGQFNFTGSARIRCICIIQNRKKITAETENIYCC